MHFLYVAYHHRLKISQFMPKSHLSYQRRQQVTLDSSLSLQKFSKDVEKLLGPNGSNLFEKRKNKSFLQEVTKLMESMHGFQEEPGNLKEYSPWLSGFKADPFSNELEIPGLATGFKVNLSIACGFNVYLWH